MSTTGDYIFGKNTTFLIDSPQAVAQAIQTRLSLFVGDWFLDNRIGLDKSLILGYETQGTRDSQIKDQILGTQGVNSIINYASNVDPLRNFVVSALVDTIYGQVTINRSF